MPGWTDVARALWHRHAGPCGFGADLALRQAGPGLRSALACMRPPIYHRRGITENLLRASCLRLGAQIWKLYIAGGLRLSRPADIAEARCSRPFNSGIGMILAAAADRAELCGIAGCRGRCPSSALAMSPQGEGVCLQRPPLNASRC